MRRLRAPSFLVGERSSLGEALRQAAVEIDLDDHAVDDIERLLPATLIESPCFFIRLTQAWCYDFDLPIDRLPGDRIAIGSAMFPPVRRLLDVLLFASRRLVEDDLGKYLRRLGDESRHHDVMAEVLVVLSLPSDVSLAFEVPAETGNCRTVDWRIHRHPQPPVLLDVKNRTGDAVAFLASLVTAGASASTVQPTHDHAVLFQGVLPKFAECSPTDCLQGVWVITKVKQEETELNTVFDALDATRVHFAVISNMNRECIALSRASVDRALLAETLNLTERPERIVFRRDS